MKNQPKIILISLVGLFVSAGLFLFVIRPTLDNVAGLNKEVSTKKTDLKQLEEQIVIYKNSQRDLSQASGKDLIAQSLLIREDLQVAIEEIEKADAIAGTQETLSITDDAGTKSVAKELVPGKSFLKEVPYTVRTNSDFPHLINFIQYLEHLPHFTEISGINLQSTAGNADSSGAFAHDGTILGSISGVFFVQK